MIKQGDRVYIRPEWQDSPRDKEIVWIALEDEDGVRVKIQPQLGLRFNPISVVTLDMLETR